jgi:hypothetical protein
MQLSAVSAQARALRRPAVGVALAGGASSLRQLPQAAMPESRALPVSGGAEGGADDEGQDDQSEPDPMAGMAAFLEALALNARRVVDILKEWHRNDEDGIGLDEMHALASKLQISVPAEAVEGVFAQWDSTHSGKLELAELERKLKGLGRSVGVSHVPPPSIPPFRTRNLKALRRHGPMIGADLSPAETLLATASDVTALLETKAFLMRHAWHVIAYFAPPDDGTNVLITRALWEKACHDLRFPGGPHAYSWLFDHLTGASASSVLSLTTLQQATRPGGELPDASPLPRYARSPRAERARRLAAGGAKPVPAQLPEIVGLIRPPPSPSSKLGVRLVNSPPEQRLHEWASVSALFDRGSKHGGEEAEGPWPGDTPPGGSPVESPCQSPRGSNGRSPSRSGPAANTRAGGASLVQSLAAEGGSVKPKLRPVLWVYDAMWRRGAGKLRLHIADTMVMDGAEIDHWLFTDRQGLVKRKNRDKLTGLIATSHLERIARKLHRWGCGLVLMGGVGQIERIKREN